jgi:hypothetical protein
MAGRLTAEQLRLAGLALRQAVAGDYTAAGHTLTQLGAGARDAIPQVLLAWIDTTAAECGITEYGAATVGPAWCAEDTGEMVTDADQVDPAARWAGRLFAARIGDDEKTWVALVTSVTSDEEWSAGCAQVLGMAAATIRAARDGRLVGVLRGGRGA